MKVPHVETLSLKYGLSLKRQEVGAFGIATPSHQTRLRQRPESSQRDPASTDIELGDQVRVYARAGSPRRRQRLIGVLGRLR